jgi:hypothetical protein
MIESFMLALAQHLNSRTLTLNRIMQVWDADDLWSLSISLVADNQQPAFRFPMGIFSFEPGN